MLESSLIKISLSKLYKFYSDFILYFFCKILVLLSAYYYADNSNFVFKWILLLF